MGLFWLAALVSWVGWNERAGFEVPAYLTAVLLVLHSRHIRALFTAIGPARTAIMGVFFGALLLGQVLREGRAYYPFTMWTMYSTPQPVHGQYRELILVEPDGTGHRVFLHSGSPFRSNAAFYRRLRIIEEEPEQLGRTLLLLAAGHPRFEAAERLEWRLWKVRTDERPLRPELVPEEVFVVPLR